jgi:hypothetical protein
MTESLSQMVKQGSYKEQVTFSEENLSIPENDEPTEVIQENQETSIDVVPLSVWFDDNLQNFSNLTKPTYVITGIDPLEQLLVTVPHPSGESGKRKLVLFDDSHLTPVLDLPAIDMQIYSNGFRIVYQLTDTVYIKSYGVRTGLISVFCNDIDDKLIPYHIVKTKKKNLKPIDIMQPGNINSIRQKMSERVDIESLQLLYKQSSKAEGLQTNMNAIDWLLERQASIEDVNHHLQIDNVIINILA